MISVKLCLQEACNSASSEREAAKAVSDSLQQLSTLTQADGFSYQGSYFKFWEEFPQLTAEGTLLSEQYPLVPNSETAIQSSHSANQPRDVKMAGWQVLLGVGALVAMLL